MNPVKSENNFNLLRLLAAAEVVLVHGVSHLELPLSRPLLAFAELFPGVPVFFVISGFLVSDSCLRSSIADFFSKRALRIYPALAINILVLESLLMLTGGRQINDGVAFVFGYLTAYIATASDWIGSLAAPDSYGFKPAFYKEYPSGVLWTLTVELSFYLVLPVLIAVGRRKRSIGALLVLVCMIASFVIVTNADNAFYAAHPLTQITIVPYFWLFAFGVLARLYWDRVARWLEGKFVLWLVVYGGVAFVSAEYLGGLLWIGYKYQAQVTDFVRAAFMAATVLSAAFTMPSLTRRLALNENDFSYGLYLYHMLVISTLLGFGITGQWWELPFTYAAGLALAAISWFLVEKNALKAKRRFSWRPPASSTAPIAPISPR